MITSAVINYSPQYSAVQGIVPNPNADFSMDQRLKDLLSNLGRRTLRGVKPCPKCGTYNGTRGFSCKNKSCDVVFKAADDRKKKTTEACRISTENQNAQVGLIKFEFIK